MPGPMKFDTIRKHLPRYSWFGKWEVLRGLKEQEERVKALESVLVRLGDCAQRELCAQCAEALDVILGTIKQ